MIPFSLTFQPGTPLYEQVVYAAKKAIVSGQMLPGDAFPSVRELSRGLKINPNTAHKTILELVSEGLIEVRTGRGTFVATRILLRDRRKLLQKELEQLVVEAKKLGLNLTEVSEALIQHWHRLDAPLETRKSDEHSHLRSRPLKAIS